MPPPILEAIVPAAIASIATSEPVQMEEPVEPAAPAASIEPVELVELIEPGEVGMRRIFHLSDGNAFALELEQRLESEGYAIEAVASVDELSDLFMCLLPQLLLVDASHLSQLAIIGALRREAQQSSQPPRHIQMVVLATHDDLKTRRAAHRAGVDLLLFPPFDITDLSGRLQALNATVAMDQVRVLIVEDNRADAFFAQSVLTRVGMQVEVEQDPMKVLDSLKSQRPDLVLMDLHMPFANGVEVTMLIREHPLFSRVPIVFLSGESDPDSHLEAINAGGDDFLFKPIRPRHLIAAVRDRVRGMHPINKEA
ncbi:MAG TPA: response regulator [Xanthomonadaceae bacterium]|nr:response regulator [Xanthomonadaceae bacterium]